MKINIKKFLEEAGVVEPFYPGKKIILPCRQAGEFKSHCVVLDWRNPDKIRLEVKPGLSGKDLEAKQLKKYPVSLQSPTYVEIEIINDNSEDEDDEEGKAKGGSSSGGKGLVKKKGLEGLSLGMMAEAFGNVVEGKTPDFGKIVEIVILGSKVAAEAFASVMDKLAHQIKHTKVSTTELLAKASDLLTKVKPPAFMAPKGDETADYKYDREKNADIGFRHNLG